MTLDRLGRHPHLVAALVSLVLAAAMDGPALVPGRALSTADIWWFSTPWTAERPANLSRPSQPAMGVRPQTSRSQSRNAALVGGQASASTHWNSARRPR